jgi:hypothetical protein
MATPTNLITMLKYFLLYKKYQLPNAANVLHMRVVKKNKSTGVSNF